MKYLFNTLCVFLLIAIGFISSIHAQQCQPPPPNAPTVTATAGPAHGEITVSASVPATASSTTVWISGDGGVSWGGLVNFYPSGTTSYIATGLDTNFTYYFYSSASNNCGTTNSGAVSATTLDIAVPTVTATAGPGYGKITVSASVPTGATSTTVYISGDGGASWGALDTFIQGGSTSYTAANLDTNFTYQVYAVAVAGSRYRQSATVSVTTYDIAVPTMIPTAGPNHGQIIVSAPVPAGATYTTVYVSADGINFDFFTNFNADQEDSYIWSGLSANQTFYFYAVAVAGSRYRQSGTVSATTFDINAPSMTASAGPGEDKITVSAPVPAGATNTIVYVSTDGVNFNFFTNFNAGQEDSYVWGVGSGLDITATYYFYAVAVAGTRQRESGIVQITLNKDQNAGNSACNIRVGAPVNVNNGNMYLQQIDYNLPGVGESIDVRRTYNSIVQSSGLFGYGWATQYDENIIRQSSNNIRLGLADGRAVYFGRTSSTAAFTPVTPDFYGEITENTDLTYTLVFKDGRTHKFTSGGKLMWLKDRNGNQTTLTYDTSGYLTEIEDSFGRTLTVTMNLGNVTQISDDIGTVADYLYNTDGTLESVTYADGSEYHFEYTSVGSGIYLTAVKDALDNILEAHEYDSSGRATTSEKDGGAEKYTLDYSHIADTESYTTVTDALNRTTKYYFSAGSGRGVVTKIEGNCNCGGGAETTVYEYDAQLNLVKKTDALLNETDYTYDTNGNRLTMTDVLGTETYTYNSFGEILTKTDRMNGVTTNTYDTNGNLLTTEDALGNTTTLTYTALGQIAAIEDARNNTTTLAYDADGRLIEAEDANGKTTAYDYDARARLTSVTNALNETVDYQYDLNNRLKKIIYPDTKFIEFTYDAAGRRTKVKDARGNETTFDYDAAYRLTSVTDALNHQTTFDYDLMSNRTAQTDALGNETNYEYDDYNRLKKVIYPPAATNAARLEEAIEYDAVGNVTKRTDAASRETVYEYDDANRLIATTDALNDTTAFEYNDRSQMTKVIDASNQEYDFTYDALGRQLSQTRAGSTMSYEYDAVGSRTKRTDYLGRETDYTYDDLNRLTNIAYVNQSSANATYAYDDLSRLTSAANNAGTISFTYDNRGRIETTSDVFAHDIEYGYDGNGNRTLLKFDNANYATYAYDVANRLTSITNVSDSADIDFNYDDANRLTSKVLPNGITSNYTYDGLSRLTGLKDETSSTTLFDRQMSYNTANQISQIVEPTLTRNFAYDDVDRLTGVTNGASTTIESYAFDGVGNRTSSHTSSSYTYQSNNRLTASQTASYGYNANGNLTSKTVSSTNWTYVWDYENRMTSASDGTTTVSYQYDALGRRTKRTQGTTVTKFIYDGQDVLADDNAGTLTKYLNGAGIDNKLRVQTGSSVSYFLTDHLGSPNGLANSSGGVTASTNYDSFGNATNSTFPMRYQYTGREYDSFTGLHYYRARFYDANLGRFISEDPIGLSGGINQFAYVGNNSLNATDPTGLYEEDVHFYLTWYLAKRNGCFSEVEARYIGFSAQYVDENPDTRPDLGSSAEQRSKNRDYHALHSGGHNLYLGGLWRGTGSGDRASQLNALGTYLHYQQDTFSHEGFQNPIYGHLFGTHLVDKTSNDVEKAMRMAGTTWSTLNTWTKENCGCEGTWTSDMSSQVKQFSEAPGGNWFSSRAFSIEQNDRWYMDNKRRILDLPMR